MKKPPKVPKRIKKSLDWKEDDYNAVTMFAQKDDVRWSEMARMIISMGVWAYRAKDK